MATITEGTHDGEFLGEFALGPAYHNDKMTVISGQNLKAGAVIGIITASGKVTAYNPAAADGSQNAAGILKDAVNATAADAAGIVVRRGPGCVNGNDLVWAGGVTDPQKVTAKTALLALGIRAL